MMRTSRNSALFLAAASGLVYMASCSSEVKYDGGEQENLEDAPAFKYSYTVHASDASRIHNFNDGTRADEDVAAPSKELVLVSQIDAINYDGNVAGDISATGLSFDSNGSLYVSYHLKDAGSKGLIEYIKYDNNQYVLGGYMEADSLDFNHLMLDGDNVVVVGNHTFKKDEAAQSFAGGKGAIIGKLAKTFYTESGSQEKLLIKQITTDDVLYSNNASGDAIRVGYKGAGDANCVIAYGDNYYVTTTSGNGVLTKDFKKVHGTFVKTSGHSKHIDNLGSIAAVLSLNADNTVALQKYDLSAGNYTTPIAEGSNSNIGSLSIANGKNTVAIDDDETIYACLTDGGLVRVKKDGSTFKRTFGTGKMPVNGVAVDANYVYVAVGNFLYVLDKTSEQLESVCHTQTADNHSANYVAVNGNMIAVAFGKDGLMVFKFKE